MRDNSSAFNSDLYDEKIISVLPYYNEFHNQVTDLVSVAYNSNFKWLDTGCGTGTLACKMLEKFDISKAVLCDPSEKMLEAAKRNLYGKEVEFRNISSEQLDYNNKFDLVTAVQAHHYLSEYKRKIATQRCFNALKAGGLYITFENIEMSNKISNTISIERWKNYMFNNGKTEQEVNAHVARRGTEVFPVTIEKHLQIIKDCGFKSADILWTSYMQAGFFAFK